ncbi:sulfotransferase [Virgisporangium aliadipatigenens]|uniref:Sulfotransferase n=1 Tax=Virgisporangium aliadipatigenens TaxID=741659 RepID=A0A8J3YHQ4_9ACTN|nr:sulfotransferase [Virgisporangium aliadipatigenens]GIJ44190.1 sulfotransferase [Virgisporangium aliadipatigenens]
MRVLYVAGTGRSGSTLVAAMLGQLRGAFAAGEVRYVWQRGLADGRPCGCGTPVPDCPVWTDILTAPPAVSAATAVSAAPAGVASPAAPPDAAVAAAFGERLRLRLRLRRLPLFLWRRVTGRPPVPPHPDDAALAALYTAVAARTGADVVIDSSKLPPYGALLGALPGIELKVLHLVRDPRAAAFSWGRRRGLDGASDPTRMDRPSPLRSAALWLCWNVAARLFWRGDAYLRVRYEELCADPGGTVRRVATFAGLPTGPLPFTAPGVIDLAVTHTVAGNPARHRTGPVAVRVDDEWRDGLSRRSFALVTAVCAAALGPFGYRVRRR